MYMQQGMLPEAAGSLGQLIKGGIAPRAFWGVLLGESVGMLEVQPGMCFDVPWDRLE